MCVCVGHMRQTQRSEKWHAYYIILGSVGHRVTNGSNLIGFPLTHSHFGCNIEGIFIKRPRSLIQLQHQEATTPCVWNCRFLLPCYYYECVMVRTTEESEFECWFTHHFTLSPMVTGKSKAIIQLEGKTNQNSWTTQCTGVTLFDRLSWCVK